MYAVHVCVCVLVSDTVKRRTVVGGSIFFSTSASCLVYTVSKISFSVEKPSYLFPFFIDK